MSYSVEYDFTYIPTDKTTEELNELISSKLSDLVNHMINGNKNELEKLNCDDEFVEQYDVEIEELDSETIFKELKELVSVQGSCIFLSSNTDGPRHDTQPLLKLFAPLMNKEFVTFYSVYLGLRDGIGANASLLTKEGDLKSLDDVTISLNK